ncbi:uncharacterized protein E5676_scaffold21G003900 [Cucumis melo var. makuwa]|uniref:DUF7890 domain-containing protein n=2 Tax=Cucumis melo TaxID=3656 RepID=A0A5D3D246_CUCMM|nr:uncharacterized protein E6C27_scaffold74G001940 [Cucumis melo var. makuwa]TYK16569.1 uncharacterized protein E5676_scaffold21G003900 [Cucumis melo var. makuwa]
MISNLISSLNKKLQAVEISNRCKRTKKTTYVYRDDLTKKKHSPPLSSSSPQHQPAEIKKVKKRVRFADTEPVIIAISTDREEEEEETEKKVVRITVKLTKQEANRMLSRCSNDGVLEFGDVASELLRIPPTRVSSSLVAN